MQTLVIVGITGDLSRRKLLPALCALKRRGRLPLARIIGTSRRELDRASLLEPQDPLADMLEVLPLAEAARIQDAIYYLAVPPGTAGAVVSELAEAGQSGLLALEKPFGSDTASAQAQADAIHTVFSPERVFRIDHYLAKPLVSRLAALNLDPSLVGRIEVIASESLGLEGRANFYEATGALRDFGNHLLSLLAASLGARDGHERAHLLHGLSLVRAARAQYDGYALEAGHATDTETFFVAELAHGQYPNMKITLTSGKGLAAKETLVRVWQGGVPEEFAQLPGDADSYERIFEALMAHDRSLFLEQEEVDESWRIMDKARLEWGPLAAYERGAPLQSVLGQLGL